MAILKRKKIISNPLMMENPAKSPMVPPMVDSFDSRFAFSSFVTLSKVGVSKLILTHFRFTFVLYAENINEC